MTAEHRDGFRKLALRIARRSRVPRPLVLASVYTGPVTAAILLTRHLIGLRQ